MNTPARSVEDVLDDTLERILRRAKLRLWAERLHLNPERQFTAAEAAFLRAQLLDLVDLLERNQP